MEETSLLKAKFWREKIIVVFLLITFLLNLFLWFLIFFNYKNLKEITILHYSVLTGVDRLDKKIYLFEMPLVALIILIINLILMFFQKKEKILNYFLVFSSFLINLSLIVATILIFTL